MALLDTDQEQVQVLSGGLGVLREQEISGGKFPPKRGKPTKRGFGAEFQLFLACLSIWLYYLG
ncbi:hypothetical protein LY78DRAFT_662328, partial [Colletotrichum sublineola]